MTMGNWQRRQINANGTAAIAEIYPHKAASYKAKNNRTVKCMVLSEADEANARLIAAAPAMLEALQELLFRVNRNDAWVKHANPAEAAMREGVVKKARAAIALAKGE